MDAWIAVPFGQQFEDSLQVVDKADIAELECVFGTWPIGGKYQHWQALVRLIQRSYHDWPRARIGQAFHLERSWDLLCCQQTFERQAMGADEGFTRILVVGKSGLQQKESVSGHGISFH